MHCELNRNKSKQHQNHVFGYFVGNVVNASFYVTSQGDSCGSNAPQMLVWVMRWLNCLVYPDFLVVKMGANHKAAI